MPKLGVRLGIAVTVLVGCGGGGSGFNPGVAGSKPLGQLSDGEAKTLCTNTSAHYRAQTSSTAGRESDCRAVGAVAASGMAATATSDLQIQFACLAGYTVCQQVLADGGVAAFGGGDGGADPCSAAPTPGATCTATVDQYSACITESEAALSKTYPPCGELTKAKLTELMSAPGGILGAGTNGPACQTFTAACPGFNIIPGI